MKHKTSELTGNLLDMAVAKARGINYYISFGRVINKSGAHNYFNPSTNWRHCGPLIELFKIDYIGHRDIAIEVATSDEVYSWGSSVQEAICRVVVKSVFGDEVEL